MLRFGLRINLQVNLESLTPSPAPTTPCHPCAIFKALRKEPTFQCGDSGTGNCALVSHFRRDVRAWQQLWDMLVGRGEETHRQATALHVSRRILVLI